MEITAEMAQTQAQLKTLATAVKAAMVQMVASEQTRQFTAVAVKADTAAVAAEQAATLG